MQLLSLAHALPENQYTQREVWDILRESPGGKDLPPRALGILEKVLLGNSGIETRHFATSDPASVFPMDPGELNAYFERATPLLAGDALSKALAAAGMKASELDALFLCTCTGYLCPGPSSYVAELLGLRDDAVLLDIVGAGCGAALPTLRAASDHLKGNPAARVAVVAVEVCSSAFFLNPDPAVLISLCLFGDAASASIWTGEAGNAGLGSLGSVRSLHGPEHREKIRFANDKGFLRNRLDRAVPSLAAGAVAEMLAAAGPEAGRLICHPGGRDVLDAIELAVPGQAQTASRAVLQRAGNCSSPSVLMALEEDLLLYPEPLPRILASFGAGFSCHMAGFAPGSDILNSREAR